MHNTVLRDTGCNHIGERDAYLKDENFSQAIKKSALFDGNKTVLKTARVDLKTQIFTGRVIAFALPGAIVGVIIRNIPRVNDTALVKTLNTDDNYGNDHNRHHIAYMTPRSQSQAPQTPAGNPSNAAIHQTDDNTEVKHCHTSGQGEL